MLEQGFNREIKFDATAYILQMPGDLGYLDKISIDLVEFYERTSDILWIRSVLLDNGAWAHVYSGGTGYAAAGAEINWRELGSALGHTGKALGTGYGGIALLAAPEPTMVTKALAVAAFVGFGLEVRELNRSSSAFVRSVSAAVRLGDY
jgi:hypothetical protein